MKSKILLSLIATTIAASSAFAGDKDKKRERPSPESVVADLIVNHDADENGSLDKTELELAMADMRKKHHKHVQQLRKRRQDKLGNEEKPRQPREDKEPREDRDRSKRVEHVMEKFDRNDDQALDSSELLALVDHMHENGRKLRGPGGHRGPREIADEESEES